MTTINCTLPILNWKGEAATMESGFSDFDENGNVPAWQAGKFLAQLLATSEAVRPEDSGRATALASMLEKRAAVEITSGEGVLIGEILKAATLAPWIRTALTYLTDPASMEEKERSVMEEFYAPVLEQTQSEGNGASPEATGSGSL